MNCQAAILALDRRTAATKRSEGTLACLGSGPDACDCQAVSRVSTVIIIIIGQYAKGGVDNRGVLGIGIITIIRCLRRVVIRNDGDCQPGRSLMADTGKTICQLIGEMICLL